MLDLATEKLFLRAEPDISINQYVISETSKVGSDTKAAKSVKPNPRVQNSKIDTPGE
jgi:hypothetical protein